MTVAVRRATTLEEFLAWDDAQPERWEFDGFAPVAMVGGTQAHSRITIKLLSALDSRLAGTRCSVFNDAMRVEAAGSIRYPDAFVACSAFEPAATGAINPIVIFEVLSPSTATTDLVVKNREYSATPSIQRYVILMQDRIAANVYERQGDRWVGILVSDPNAILDMPEIGITLPLAACYESVIEAPPAA